VDKYYVTIQYSDEDGCFIAKIPEIPSVQGHGVTREDALRELGDSYTLYLEHRNVSTFDLKRGLWVCHRKTGESYQVFEVAELLSDRSGAKISVVVYSDVEQSSWYVRSLDEFCDGRFVCL
jgi:predicted RNase H-like HicB family nuclease